MERCLKLGYESVSIRDNSDDEYIYTVTGINIYVDGPKISTLCKGKNEAYEPCPLW